MNKIKIIVIIFLFLFFSTGCIARSDITIYKDLTVLEEVRMTGSSEFFNNRYKDLPINVVKSVLEGFDRETLLKKNGYEYRIDKSQSYPAVIAKKKYASVSDFTNQTIFKSQYFENFYTSISDNLVTIKATDFIKYEDGDIERYDIKAYSLNIKLPFVVTDHNADSYDPKTNTYTWNILRETEDKEINLTFDKNKIYVYNLVMYISMFILILLGIALIFIIRKLIQKNKLNNKIVE